MLIGTHYIYYMRWKTSTSNLVKMRGSRQFLPRHGSRSVIPSPLMHISRLPFPFLFVLAMVSLAAGAAAAPTAKVSAEAPDNRHFLTELARAEREGNYRPLMAECDRQVAAQPQDHEGYRRRALARWGARQNEDALADFSRAAELARAHKAPVRVLAVIYYGRALVRREQHNTAAEAEELERVTRTDAGFTDAFNDLAWIRATHFDATLRNGRQAVTLARHACEVVPSSVKYLDTLAAAYAEAGDARRAADTERAAIKAARSDARTAGQHKDFLTDASGRVEFYAGGGQYREKSPRL